MFFRSKSVSKAGGLKARYSAQKREAGYTLIEVMIVMAIAGVLAAVVIPDFSRLIGSYSLNAAAVEMAMNIRLLQEKALRHESASYRMVFDKVNHDYSYLSDHRTNVYVTTKLPPGIELNHENFSTSATGGLGFAANGNPYYRFGGHIALKCRATGEFRYVIIDSIGRVRIDNVPP